MKRYLRKCITILLILIILLVYPYVYLFNIPVKTLAAEGQVNFASENLLKLAKGIAALYLLHTINNLVNSNSSSSPQDENISIDPGRFSEKVIVIDPGHGGFDPGAVGPGGLKEKDVNLDIALKLYDILKNNTDNRVYLTRSKDVFISLQERASMANRLNADIFISIHCNADEKGEKRGIETYAHYNTSGETWSLAWYLQESLVRELNLNDRGLKADNFHVIRETENMKSILLEIAYISNYREEAVLRDKKTADKAALAIYKGIINYYAS